MDTSRILVVGDIHAPFEHKDYLAHCKAVAKFYKTTHTVFIGDIIDGHAMSYHESDPDGHSAGAELDFTVEKLAQWHKAFPHANVILGNHDCLVWRKMKTAGLSIRWAKKLVDVLELPTWSMQLELKLDNVIYTHGESGTASKVALRRGRNVVQGHRHTESYISHLTTDDPIWAMQVGCGIDNTAYAMDYARNFPPPALSCGVVLNHGKLPILMPMK